MASTTRRTRRRREAKIVSRGQRRKREMRRALRARLLEVQEVLGLKAINQPGDKAGNTEKAGF